MLKYIYISFAACVRRVNAKKNGKIFFLQIAINNEKLYVLF